MAGENYFTDNVKTPEEALIGKVMAIYSSDLHDPCSAVYVGSRRLSDATVFDFVKRIDADGGMDFIAFAKSDINSATRHVCNVRSTTEFDFVDQGRFGFVGQERSDRYKKTFLEALA